MATELVVKPEEKKEPTAVTSPVLSATVDQKSVYTQATNLYQELLQIAGNDIIEIFGESGSGKTSFAHEVIESAKKMPTPIAPTDIIYFDDERNFKEAPKEITYRYKPKWKDMYEEVKKLDAVPSAKLIILDSLGAPILGEFATMPANERGQTLLECSAVAYRLKYLSEAKKCLVIILNQPESEFAKEKGYELQPFGDKHKFFVKEIWRSLRMDSSTKDYTYCNIESFRSRQFGRGKLLYSVEVSGAPNAQIRKVTRKWQ